MDLLGQLDSGAAHFSRHVFELWQAIEYAQHGVLVIHMNDRFESQLRDYRCVDIDQAKRRVLGKQMAAAARAPLAQALVCLAVCANALDALGDLDAVRVP